VRARRGFFVGVIAYSWVIMRGERTHFISVDPPTAACYPALSYQEMPGNMTAAVRWFEIGSQYQCNGLAQLSGQT